MFKTNEIFYSLQGEGFHTGTPAVFVRFSGCNLQCHFCDTNHQEGILMSLQEIVEEINRYPNAPMVVLTGGEPSLFIDDDFVRALKQQTGKCLAIETNGTHRLPEGLDWITFSPKTGFKGGDVAPCVLTSCDELKVVYVGQDLGQYASIQAKYRFLQPCYCEDAIQRDLNVRACVEAVLNHPGWRLSLQAHRILGIR